MNSQDGMPLVSIVIPAHNAGRFLESSVAAALSQGYKKVEIIIIDDGSSDDTPVVTERLMACDSRVLCMRTENHGVSAARNLGMEMASGEYLVFLDADDEIPQHSIERMVFSMRGNPCDFLIAGIETIKLNKNDVVASKRYAVKNAGFYDRATYSDLCSALLDAGCIQSACSKLYRADFLRGSRLVFDERLSSFEDYVFVLSCLSEAKSVVTIPDVCYQYKLRMRLSNSTTYKPDISRQMTDVARSTMTFCDRFGIDFGLFCPLVSHLYINGVNNLCKSSEDWLSKCISVRDLFVAKEFDMLRTYEGPFPNVYTRLMLTFSRKGFWSFMLLAARVRNLIRERTGQPA